jgi:hypothetical protein
MPKPVGPICVPCGRESKCIGNGVVVIIMAQDRPYEAYHADMYQCPFCKHIYISGFSDNPFATHYDGHIMDALAEAEVTVHYA